MKMYPKIGLILAGSLAIIPCAHGVPVIAFEWTEGGPGNGTAGGSGGGDGPQLG